MLKYVEVGRSRLRPKHPNTLNIELAQENAPEYKPLAKDDQYQERGNTKQLHPFVKGPNKKVKSYRDLGPSTM